MEARLTTTNVVVGSVDFKERFVYLASTIHRRYSCMYIYIYRKNIHNSNVYYRIDDEERRSRIGIQLQKPSGTKYVCVCACARCKAVNYFFLRPSPRSSPLTKRKRLPSLPRN